ncbi:hypothetical protein PHYSODRAFT_336253 [Phytophthora sojae]|uniref:Uncharacterized protein n=1 Tax=Phytophthora sojae (strain P6497) TaxID=1094619 RepID=G4ZWY4_PHYSP|nr:hypothetical protein PHYSODRAFT_336253 [Phytophthora sojae]EGZ11755.1 hypothetical protein PHYSODRAFT_336253 [Phytophthora sojae]|eukprot:XP_009532088.1 hypothetical protein PHYSODRAFT_336253 [Phytophthora sojae]
MLKMNIQDTATTKTPSVTRQRVEDLKQRDQVATETRGVDGSLDELEWNATTPNAPRHHRYLNAQERAKSAKSATKVPVPSVTWFHYGE